MQQPYQYHKTPSLSDIPTKIDYRINGHNLLQRKALCATRAHKQAVAIESYAK